MSDHQMVARRFGRNLAAARRRSGLSQEDVGFRVGMNRAQIGVMERGERCPRIDTLVKLAAALESPLDGPLFDGICWRPATTRAGAFYVRSADSAAREAGESGVS